MYHLNEEKKLAFLYTHMWNLDDDLFNLFRKTVIILIFADSVSDIFTDINFAASKKWEN